MALKDKINEDIKVAFKNGEIDAVSTLRFLMSVIKNKELEKRTKLSKEGNPEEELGKLSELSDEEVVSVISGDIKKRGKSIDQYKKGNREDLVKKESKELEIIKKYLTNER